MSYLRWPGARVAGKLQKQGDLDTRPGRSGRKGAQLKLTRRAQEEEERRQEKRAQTADPYGAGTAGPQGERNFTDPESGSCQTAQQGQFRCRDISADAVDARESSWRGLTIEPTKSSTVAMLGSRTTWVAAEKFRRCGYWSDEMLPTKHGQRSIAYSRGA